MTFATRPLGTDLPSPERMFPWRAGCAPFVVFSFLMVGFYALDQAVTLPGDFVWTVAGYGISVAAGAFYLWRALQTGWERAAAIGVFAPLMIVALWWYGLFFSMIVLNIYP